MKCTLTDLESTLLLTIEESLDALTTSDVKALFDVVVAEKPRRVVVDLERLTLIDSSGIGALVSLFKRVTADGGAFEVRSAQDQPRLVLDLLGLDRLFALAA